MWAALFIYPSGRQKYQNAQDWESPGQGQQMRQVKESGLNASGPSVFGWFPHLENGERIYLGYCYDN